MRAFDPVTVHGKATAVVLSAEEFARFTRHRGKLSAALLRTEIAAEDLEFSCNRGVEL